MNNKNFDIIVKRVGNVLKENGFTEQPIRSTSDDQINAAFCGNSGSIRLTLDVVKKRVELYVSRDLDIHDQTVWNLSSSWLFDPETDGEKEAISISNDFIDLLNNKSSKKNLKAYKEKSEDERNIDSKFFINRLLNAFPQIKDYIETEKAEYESFRYVTFIKEHVVDLVNELFRGYDNVKIKRFCKLLNDNYENGNKDVRAIITMVILNSVEDEKIREKIIPMLSEDLQKACKASVKFKNKKVRPEKIKNKKNFMSKLIESAEKQQANK